MTPAGRKWWASSQLLGLSLEIPASPRIGIRHTSAGPGATGWGLAWHPPEDRAAVVIKDPTPASPDPITRMLSDWPRFRSALFVGHLRGAARRMTQEDTQPFQRIHGGRHHLLAHNGALAGFAEALPLPRPGGEEPVGHTDTEHAFCWLLERLREAGARTLADAGWERLRGWLEEVNRLGSLNLLWSDGRHLLAYQDRRGFNPLHWLRVTRPDRERRFEAAGLTLELGGVRDAQGSAILVSTHPLSDDPWQVFEGGQLLVLCRGAVVWDSTSTGRARVSVEPAATAPEPAPRPLGPDGSQAAQPAAAQASPAPPSPDADTAGPRCYDIVHVTRYRYDEPVESSQHVFRLRPVHDVHQHVHDFALVVSPMGEQRDYEDVFGNRASRLRLDGPYDTLQIESRSSVVILPGVATAGLGAEWGRSTIPLVWMPWQRQMMTPYLLPPELPETQLRELFDYAMSFVERQDYDLVEVLGDINRTIRADFAYVQGVTTVETTPYEVLTTRRGVCQDFANLMICLARLLGVPARYRTGYIDTGGDYENKVQSDASHAWVEVFLPWGGWRGFDPTNGVLVGLDHVRVACGRNFRDATPTEGTIHRGGGTETLTIEVKVRRAPLPPGYSTPVE